MIYQVWQGADHIGNYSSMAEAIEETLNHWHEDCENIRVFHVLRVDDEREIVAVLFSDASPDCKCNVMVTIPALQQMQQWYVEYHLKEDGTYKYTEVRRVDSAAPSGWERL